MSFISNCRAETRNITRSYSVVPRTFLHLLAERDLLFFGFIKNDRRPGSSEVHVTSDTLGREFDPGKRDFSH